MRIKHKVNVRIADDTEMKNYLFAPDDLLAEVVIDSYIRQTSGKFHIAANDNEDLTLGDVDAVKGIYLQVNKDVVVTLNGAVGPIQLRRAGTATDKTAKLFLEADISQVNIAAPVDEEVEGVYCVWGDVAP